MFFSLLFAATVAFNGVMSVTTIDNISCHSGYYYGVRCYIPGAKATDIGMLEAKLVNGTSGCTKGKYYIDLIRLNVYLTVLSGCSGTFSIVKLDPPAYHSGCGVNIKSDGFKIIGGERAPACQYPWMALVIEDGYLCGGSIIDKDHILTSAACLYSQEGELITSMDKIEVRTGSIHLRTGVQRGVKQIFARSDYNKTHLHNNIGILRLNESIKFDGCHSPVCIGSDKNFDHSQTECRIMGWGQSTTQNSFSYWLQWATESIVSAGDCKAAWPYNYADGSVICTRADNTGFCAGDAGSPMVCLDGNKWFAYGISSGRRGKTCTYNVELLTSVPYYYDWIQKTIDSS